MACVPESCDGRWGGLLQPLAGLDWLTEPGPWALQMELCLCRGTPQLTTSGAGCLGRKPRLSTSLAVSPSCNLQIPGSGFGTRILPFGSRLRASLVALKEPHDFFGDRTLGQTLALHLSFLWLVKLLTAATVQKSPAEPSRPFLPESSCLGPSVLSGVGKGVVYGIPWLVASSLAMCLFLVA